MRILGAAETNWSGSHRYRARELHRPRTREELLRVLAAAGPGRELQIRATRHTFTDVGDAPGLLDLSELPEAHRIEIDPEARTATVGPGVTYAMLAEALRPAGLALGNLASLPHISVAGAIATATHGSGDGQGNLATAVAALEILTAAGDRVRLDREDPRLAGAAVHLGALGVVTAVTLDLLPAYELRQDVYLGLEWDALAAGFDAVMGAGRSVSVFHDLGPRAREVWVKAPGHTAAPDVLLGARRARSEHNPVPDGLPANCTAQLGVPGPWSERLPHFRSGFTPSSGEEIQSEWFVARGDAIAALDALRAIAEEVRPVLRVAELRTVAADALWLSPQHGRESAALHFTWRLEPDGVRAACARIEEALAPLDPRPHWGKLYVGPAPEYPRAGDWRALRGELDPGGAFANRWLREQDLV